VLLKKLKDSGMFRRWLSRDAVGSKSLPIALLLLGALRYLGRGLTFDDLEEYTSINEETHRQFFRRFIEYGATVLYREYVQYPQTATEYMLSAKKNSLLVVCMEQAFHRMQPTLSCGDVATT
jgi:hypothetical protein